MSGVRATHERPAFYALGRGRVGDLVTLLHPPYTAWHLSYVALGAAAAPTVHPVRLAAALAAFALGWGAFPAFTGYFAQAERIALPGVLVAAGALAISVAQRRLSTPARELRRRTESVTGQQRLVDGQVIDLTTERLSDPLEGALRSLWIALVLLAAGLIAVRL